jgi:hypothetical protein
LHGRAKNACVQSCGTDYRLKCQRKKYLADDDDDDDDDKHATPKLTIAAFYQGHQY